MLKPNFTSARLEGDQVIVNGKSATDPESGPAAEEIADIVGIRVVLTQGERVDHSPVNKVSSTWSAVFNVKDEEGKASDFHAGEATVVGVETHRENATVISWAQKMPIA